MSSKIRLVPRTVLGYFNQVMMKPSSLGHCLSKHLFDSSVVTFVTSHRLTHLFLCFFPHPSTHCPTTPCCVTVIPKRNSVFAVEINGFVSHIYGSKFEQRASERSAKKFKVRGTIDLWLIWLSLEDRVCLNELSHALCPLWAVSRKCNNNVVAVWSRCSVAVYCREHHFKMLNSASAVYLVACGPLSQVSL